MAQAPRPFILYVTRPDEAERWLGQLRDLGLSRIASFTGNTGPEEREALLRRWKSNEIDGMVATSAFGLGVDKSDVRTILHATLPESLDRYYQEVGRSGRDGRASASLLLYTDEDLDQAKSMASTKVARERTAFERWCLMIDKSQPDPDQAEICWLNLERLPARLVQQSQASAEWNVKTILLMARAGMLELVALTRSREQAGQASVVQSDAEARFAAVRLLHENHRNEEAFRLALAKGRAEVRRSGTEGYRAMLAVAQGRMEIAQALRQIYSVVRPGAWSPVTEYCGGCPLHWGTQRWPGRPQAPVVARMDRFQVRNRYKRWIGRWPLASDNLLVIGLPSDSRYIAHCEALVRSLVHALAPHTLVLGPGCSHAWGCSLLQGAGPAVAELPFVESQPRGGLTLPPAGRHEVRLIVWGSDADRAPPDALWASLAALDILIIPEGAPHPTHAGRRFLDTTAHIHAQEIMNDLST